MKYERFTPSDCRDVGIRKFGFLAMALFLITHFWYIPGIYVHCGNAYHSNTPEQVRDIRNNALNSVKRY